MVKSHFMNGEKRERKIIITMCNFCGGHSYLGRPSWLAIYLLLAPVRNVHFRCLWKCWVKYQDDL